MKGRRKGKGDGLDVYYDGHHTFGLATDDELELMEKEWDSEPLILHAIYTTRPRKKMEKDLPGFYNFWDKYSKSGDEKLLKKYADKVFDEDDKRTNIEKLERLLENIVSVDDKGVVLRHMALSEPQIGVHPNYGENMGKVILAEELGAHFVCQALKLRSYERKLEKQAKEEGEEINLPRYMALLDGLGDGEIKDPEMLAVKKISRHYGQKGAVARHLPESRRRAGEETLESLEAAADYIRVKVAEKVVGKKGVIGSYFAVNKFDPLYLRVEQKLKRWGVKRSDIVRDYVLNIAPKSYFEKMDLNETSLEKEIAKERKRMSRDSYISMGVMVGVSSLFGVSPYMVAGPAGFIPAYMGVRTARRLPYRIKRSVEESDNYLAKKLTSGGRRVKGAFASLRKGGKKKKVKKKGPSRMARGVSKAFGKMKPGLEKVYWWGGWRKADRGLNRITGNRWNRAKKRLSQAYWRYSDAVQTGIVPLPKGRVLDLYGYGDNAWVKRKFTKERVRESYGELVGHLGDLGVDGELLEEFGKYSDKIKILDEKELGKNRGLMKLVPRYVFNEYNLAYKRKGKG